MKSKPLSEIPYLYLESCNYEDFPIGGQLTFAKQLLKVFGNELALVGFVTEDFPIGSWQKKTISGIEYNFFALFKDKKTSKKPIIPRRLRTMLAIIKYKKAIKQFTPSLAITRCPEIVFPVSRWKYPKFCYYFAGTGNPLAISRRWYGRLIAGFYDSIFFPSLSKVNIILAAADDENINETLLRSKNILKNGDIKKFPTRIDTSVFKPIDKQQCRNELNINIDKTIVVTTGRLHWAKGWKFMLDSFQLFLNHKPNSLLYFIGDGDAYESIIEYISLNKLEQHVILLGFQNHQTIASYINASDLYIMGSFMEGWATSLVEAKACGVPVCTTKFSSANSIIKNGIDGYVVENRECNEFSNKMLSAIQLKIDYVKLEQEIQQYSIKSLKNDFLKICNQQ